MAWTSRQPLNVGLSTTAPEESQHASGSRFLNLPYELRSQIYSELLCATSNNLTLYRAPYGRPAPLDLHPQILCTNRQISNEAYYLLYSNTYLIDFTSPSIGPSCTDDGEPSAEFFLPPDLRSLEYTQNEAFTQDWKHLSTKSRFYSYIFKRLQYIKIIADDRCLWDYRMLGPYWSQNGCILHDILSCLSEGPAEEQDGKKDVSKTLAIDLTITQNEDGRHSLNGRGEWDEVRKDFEKLLFVLGTVKTTRTVTTAARLVQSRHARTGKLNLDDWMGMKTL